MQYLEFLERVHATLRPPTYLEIGVRNGDSIALSRSPSVGIDPAYRLKPEIRGALRPDVRLFRQTSDEYFARERPLRPLGGRRIAFSFIDGMHLVEYALRDFVNVERHARWTGVVVFDDILPREAAEASRDRQTRAWTGDVFKVLGILARHRPDLVCLRIGTEPTGLLAVVGLNPRSRVLHERYDEIVADAVRPDPQDVPADVLERRGVLEPEQVLRAGFWPVLRELRDGRVKREHGMATLRRALAADFGSAVSPGRFRRLLARRA